MKRAAGRNGETTLSRKGRNGDTTLSRKGVRNGDTTLSRRNARDGNTTLSRKRQALIPSFSPAVHRWQWGITWLTLLGVQVAVFSMPDSFRFPKELVLRAGAIGMLLIFGLTLLLRPREVRKSPPAHVFLLPLAVIGWTLITTVASTNPRVSLDSVLYVGSATIFFLAVLWVGRDLGLGALHFLLIPAAINTLVLLIQYADWWNPIEFEKGSDPFFLVSGFIGNRNDAGMYLIAPTLVALALALIRRGRPRIVAGTIGVVCLLGIVATGNLTALIAVFSASLCMIWLVSPRWGLVATLAVPFLFALVMLFFPPLKMQLEDVVAALLARDFDAFSTGRAAPFAAAAEMARDHPLTGIGPGSFTSQYFDYKIRAQELYPVLNESPFVGWMFSEAHSDHLEVVAETGWIGYMLLLISAVVLSRASVGARPAGTGFRGQFSSLIALPLAVALLVAALAQFPLQLASTLTGFLFVAALALRWRDVEA